ncbi:hypothetical protein HYDPIDRAFT_29166 [Hydnomerulius pinastri MD-312]|uniref:RRM domain-containing protein n=1 Tax=Hydnomerulius pinastri MD-312 TaxID=994086 RepID=A0A0C9W8J1_9AGAM|nr:hypothetical protein HYDPIDRAFT_29166 [Hydnomerulius pinastri MD-312]
MTSPSSPPQTPVTIFDLSSAPTISPYHPAPSTTVESSSKTAPDTPISSRQLPAPPTPPDSSSRNNSLSSNSSMSLFQFKVQPTSPSHSINISSSAFQSSHFCPSPATSKSIDSNGSAKALPQPADHGSVHSLPLSTKFQSTITPSFSFAGASGSDYPCDHMFPDSGDSQCSSTPESSDQALPGSSASQRTPNVYINGLPPHFPEQELFALARQFGEVKSVRTFTRHVSEKPTGYGFVLFDDVDSAERCIEGLRKYRNLHPSFSKQVHRIPGTAYAQHHGVQQSEYDENTFKARMEKLKDQGSTNLYIEGLPLSIDDESLAALMLPYKIKSSRFFKTKLSDPPRIIAFVRLETRSAAEETIERLHGRMVRGWNDPGCRISVRFADSAEQRELRRAERTLNNGDQSPARLTIAQAALLNLRGQELRTGVRNVPASHGHRPTAQTSARSLSENYTPFDRAPGSGVLSGSSSLATNLRYAYDDSPVLGSHDLPDTPNMDALLQSVQSMGYDDGLLDNTLRSASLGSEYLAAQQAQLQALASAALLSSNAGLSIALPRGQTQARNGFTPAEELILQAHAQRLQFQAQQCSPVFKQDLQLPPTKNTEKPFRSKLNPNTPSFNGASIGALQAAAARASGLSGRTRFSQDILPTISEDDFHAMSQLSLNATCSAQTFQAPLLHGVSAGIANGKFVRPPSRAISIVPPPPSHDRHGKRPGACQQPTVHLLELDHPPRRSSSSRGHQFTQSVSSQYENQAQQSYQKVPARSSSITSDSTSIISSNNGIELQQNYIYPHAAEEGGHSSPEEAKDARFYSSPMTSHADAHVPPYLGGQQSASSDQSKSPVVVSPALTYSSRTPSTLSPSTPFFGSFTPGQDAFEIVTSESEDTIEKKLKVRAGSK